jgi:hypothetical protein
MRMLQMLLAQFSQANSKLAVENDKLRVGRQALANDHAEVLNEIEYLRSRLNMLEDVTASAPGTPARRGSGSLGPHSTGNAAESQRAVEQMRNAS